MTGEQRSFILTIIVAIACFLIWKFSGISLSHEMPADYSILPHPTTNTNKEKAVYLIFAILLSICFYYPYYLTRRYIDWKFLSVTMLSIIFLSLIITYISSNTKGLLLSNWFGDDFGFTVNLLQVFFIAPIIYFVMNRLFQFILPFRSLCYLFLMSFAIYFASKLLSHPVSDFIVTTVRHILIDGYFIALYAIAFGIISIDANKKKLKEQFVKVIDDDQILDN